MRCEYFRNTVCNIETPVERLYQYGLTEIRTWRCNYIHVFHNVIIHPYLNLNGALTEVITSMSNHIPLFYVDVITNPCHDSNAALAYLPQ